MILYKETTKNKTKWKMVTKISTTYENSSQNISHAISLHTDKAKNASFKIAIQFIANKQIAFIDHILQKPQTNKQTNKQKQEKNVNHQSFSIF